ncbi:NAD(P)/FAD-dependent oxidoreductase [Leeuwenhoekiella sp. NPDC079379]|uniref:NAD(P)/FAD-dependent oxidoreductase n=1 Tax=Leeuwenhoekiella sp. NPDC079379 TaxID=3364122 RepID=UPI0037C7626A
MTYDAIIIGGGAAGFFTAINLAKLNSNLNILIVERGAQVLEKVKISGGGRCNVTHSIFEPRPLTDNYPRGKRELLGPFHTFLTGDTMAWFEERGVSLKIEDDGRIFPTSDSSQTIIDCFLKEAETFGITIKTKCPIVDIGQIEGQWQVKGKTEKFISKSVVLATGSNPKMLNVIERKGVKVISAVPSLFTFNIKDKRIESLAGLSTPAKVSLLDRTKKPIKLSSTSDVDLSYSEGPVLITHWGMSGPGILKLSAWGARVLNELEYDFFICVNWLPKLESEELKEQLADIKIKLAKQTITKWSPFDLPKRLWQSLVEASAIQPDKKWADATKNDFQNLERQLLESIFQVNGKSTFKEEFVTAGGVNLKEIDFKTYQSKQFDRLYFVGEILDIDAITGGFNFQSAWTGGYIAAQAISKQL